MIISAPCRKAHFQAVRAPDPWSYGVESQDPETPQYEWLGGYHRPWDQIWSRHTIVLNAWVWSRHQPKLVIYP